MRNETHHHPCTHEGCTKSFRSKVKLQNHMSTEHDGTNCGAFLCDQVTLHFFTNKIIFPYHLQAHSREHSTWRAHSASECLLGPKISKIFSVREAIPSIRHAIETQKAKPLEIKSQNMRVL